MLEPRETVLENKYVTIWLYPKEGIVHHQFHQYTFGDTFREILLLGLSTFESNRCTKWLSDDRAFGALLPEDKTWGNEVWRPRVLKAGWKYWGMVLPDTVTGQLNLKMMIDEYAEAGVITQIYNTPEDAMKWLLAQK